MQDTEMDGMLTIKMTVVLPTTTPRRKRVTLAKSWCARDEAKDVFAKWLGINQDIDPQLLTVEWIAHEIVFVGRES